jgi:hypothetical protein
MHMLNTSLWIAGLILQSFLLVALFMRRVARRLPVFTVLLSFYVVRSALLYSLSGHLAPDDYGTLYSALSLADIVLQIVVAGELALCVLRSANRRTGSAWIKTGLLIVLSVAIAAGAASRVSVPGRYPPDRGMAFVAILMLFLALWMIAAKVSGPPRRVAEGFAFYGAIGTLAGIERAFAAIARNARAFTAWSYISTAAWLVVVLFWIFVLRPDKPAKAVAKKTGPATRAGHRV